MAEIVPEHIEYYIDQHCSAEPDLLKELNRYTYANVLKPRMISGPMQGRLLSMISHIAQPKLIVELGTFTGYAALCLAEGLAPNGRLITIEANEEMQPIAQKFFNKSPQASQIDMQIGQAEHLISAIEGPIDLAFIDADKKNYKLYLDLLMPKMRKNGIILADNVLWYGKVTDPAATDRDTKALKEFNKYVSEHPMLQKVLLSIRDGLFMARVL
jgi:caffeoyl-CoA O-methyltransferase